MARGWPFILDLRAQALSHNLNVWLVVAFPFGLVGVPGLWLDRRPVYRLRLDLWRVVAAVNGAGV